MTGSGLFSLLLFVIAGAEAITPTITIEGVYQQHANLTAVCSYPASAIGNSTVYGVKWAFGNTMFLTMQGSSTTCMENGMMLDDSVFFCDVVNQTFKLFLTNVTESGSICCGIIVSMTSMPDVQCAEPESATTNSTTANPSQNDATHIKSSFPVWLMALVGSLMMAWIRGSNGN